MGNLLEEIMEKSILDNKNLDINVKNIIKDKYLVSNKLIVNSNMGNLLGELKKSLSECKTFYFSVAFINFSGLQLLLDSFKELEERGIKGKILTSTYLNFTQPKALTKLKEFNNIDLNIFIVDSERGFHTKVYIFENEDDYKIIIGSSNITQRALKSNIEWNVMVISKKDNDFAREVLEEYDELWNGTGKVDEKFLLDYEKFINSIKNKESSKLIEFSDYKILRPNRMQKKAVLNLDRLRASGENKALVVAATGTGKTYMSAFDVANVNCKNLLFIVHREDILRKAEITYKSICKNSNVTFGLYTGNKKDKKVQYLFATVQTLSNNLKDFYPEDFDYIVVDEAHHCTSPTYERVLNYFKPKFLLGMTATPERCDSGNIFDVFDNNVAIEVRLKEALEEELIVPFHYFGITDIDTVDYTNVNIDNISEISKRLMINSRVDFIIEKMNFYGFDGEKQRTLGFCISKEHARYMADKFNKEGINSIALTGEDPIEKRQECARRLEDDNDELKVIFTVDIFNEGVDIPSVNQVLMLRPTSSPIIFIQQLGRGLRKRNNKEFLTVLDFIGNHNKAFLISIALKGSKYYDKDSLKVSVDTDFSDIPGCSNISMDRISKERILKQLENENFNNLKYLKDEYNEFKILTGGKIPYKLMDYVKYDGAPDPLKFINYSKTYNNFLLKVEPGYLCDEIKNDNLYKIILELSNKLPIKRPHEFAIIKYLINHNDITLDKAKEVTYKYLDNCDKETINHAFNNLNQKYYDNAQVNNYVKMFTLNNNILSKTFIFEKILSDLASNKIILDILNYGLVCYEKEYGSSNYGVPFFKLYSQYMMVDIALLSNYEKKHSAFRGSGLLANGNDYFLFIDLHKEANIKESINYNDKFIDRNTFQWQTPNSTSNSSERGKNIIFNKKRNINLHLFVRKSKLIDNKVQPYIYIGKGDTIEYHGEKPITVILKLHDRISEKLFVDLTYKVNIC